MQPVGARLQTGRLGFQRVGRRRVEGRKRRDGAIRLEKLEMRPGRVDAAVEADFNRDFLARDFLIGQRRRLQDDGVRIRRPRANEKESDDPNKPKELHVDADPRSPKFALQLENSRFLGSLAMATDGGARWSLT